jgi:diguanylate cyclase (GGDEF)-like protein
MDKMMTNIDTAMAAPAPRSPRRSRNRTWALVACVILVAGLGVSAAGALLWRTSELRHERETFSATAADVSQTVGTLIRRDTDFVATVRGVLAMQPHLGATEFNAWYEALQGKQRQVGSLGTAIVEAVPAARLAAFQARRNADPAFRGLVAGKPTPIRRGPHARYCLLSAGGAIVSLDKATASIVQSDWCRPGNVLGLAEASLLRAETDTGQFLALPVNALGLPTMLLEAAFYRRGAPVASIKERRAAVAGWVVSTFDANQLISTATGNNRGLSVALYHRNPGQPLVLVGETGVHAPPGSFTRTTALAIDGSWSVNVRGRATAGRLSANTQGALVFSGGALVSILLFALLLVLTRSRERALGMVEEKTGELRHQALHDALTGLPNRVLALDRAEQMLARARRTQATIAALYVDIDGFKHVNDTLGHAAGDELLKIVAERLQTVIRESDTAARLAGDEFVILLDGATVDVGPELVAERLLEVLREPYDMSGDSRRQLTVTASIGVAYGQGSASELLADADVALYVAKSAGKNRHVVFESKMQTAAQDRLTLEMDLGDALAEDQLFLVYQPTFDLRSEQAIGVEALLRWRHPVRGVIAPDAFIPIAEDSGLIIPIGRWVLENACRQAASWREQGYELNMSVNVSARQLDHDELIDDVRQSLERNSLEASTLTIEITETTLMRDADATAERLAALKELGVRIAIDDFGTGYSSLAYLRQFPVDALKIDRSFIKGIAGSTQSAALIHTLVRLGKTLSLETLAEGIEDRAQLRALQRQHCDQGQGFLFARPLEVAEIEHFLHAHGVQALTS